MAGSRTFPAILAFLFALHASGLGEGAILCVSPDGHVSLEAKGAPCCGPEAGEEPAAPVGTALAAAASIAGCGDCTDIPLGDAEASASVPAESKQAPPASSAILAHAAAVPCTDAGGARLASIAPSPGRGALSHIRSVILRR